MTDSPNMNWPETHREERREHADEVFRADCAHRGGKILEGNTFRCVRCKRIVGFVALPRGKHSV